MAREGDRARCRHCGGTIVADLRWSGIVWVHFDGSTDCYSSPTAQPEQP